MERIVYEDVDPNNGFIMVPDLKWNGSIETLYLLAIVKKRNIKSIRDLAEEHLPLLKNIQKKGIVSTLYLLVILFLHLLKHYTFFPYL